MPFNAQTDPLLLGRPDGLLIGGMFRPNGSSAVSNSLNVYVGPTTMWTVARSDVGLFTLTLGVKYPRLLWLANPALLLATGADQYAQWATAEFTEVDSLALRVWDASDAAVVDVASDAGNWISWAAIVANSGVPRP